MKKMFGNELLMVQMQGEMQGDFYACACINHIIEMLPETELSDCFPTVYRDSECDFCFILARLKSEMGDDVPIKRLTIIRIVRQCLR